MGMGGNLILLLSGEGALHHVKIIESGQQSLRAGEVGLSTDPRAKGPGLRVLSHFTVKLQWAC